MMATQFSVRDRVVNTLAAFRPEGVFAHLLPFAREETLRMALRLAKEEKFEQAAVLLDYVLDRAEGLFLLGADAPCETLRARAAFYDAFDALPNLEQIVARAKGLLSDHELSSAPRILWAYEKGKAREMIRWAKVLIELVEEREREDQSPEFAGRKAAVGVQLATLQRKHRENPRDFPKHAGADLSQLAEEHAGARSFVILEEIAKAISKIGEQVAQRRARYRARQAEREREALAEARSTGNGRVWSFGGEIVGNLQFELVANGLASPKG